MFELDFHCVKLICRFASSIETEFAIHSQRRRSSARCEPQTNKGGKKKDETTNEYMSEVGNGSRIKFVLFIINVCMRICYTYAEFVLLHRIFRTLSLINGITLQFICIVVVPTARTSTKCSWKRTLLPCTFLNQLQYACNSMLRLFNLSLSSEKPMQKR